MDNKITQTTKKVIEIECNSLSSEVSSKLNQSRQKALDGSKSKTGFFTTWYIPTTAMLVLAIYFILPFLHTNSEQQDILSENNTIIAEIEMLEQLDLVENLEFYEWLSSEQNISSI
ncbi:hypothetical protein MNBD_GAMMA01-88 [hydrothermal vent metagenome]|uniref:Uncharacterized protein n=1 Tax=hydrothermal vent metagenome TaxID=652676 RepID=A0A3B0WEM6_9ZZZZ